jgi:hypothetical protein
MTTTTTDKIKQSNGRFQSKNISREPESNHNDGSISTSIPVEEESCIWEEMHCNNADLKQMTVIDDGKAKMKNQSIMFKSNSRNPEKSYTIVQ